VVLSRPLSWMSILVSLVIVLSILLAVATLLFECSLVDLLAILFDVPIF